jgi:cytochrome c553
VRFNRDVRPILAEYCLACHGADSASRQAGLRLDREEGLFGAREGGEGPVVVRGKPEASPLYQRMVSRERDFVMPPPKAHKRPKPEEKELIRRWIAEGAVWEPHWSFIKPARPPLPAVRNERWPRNPVDRFILARLEAEGLSPAPEADRRTLARRASLDATGLPTEPELVEAFVNDPAPDAYERLVDRLLESPRYGEHRARYWLDAARYADTHGLHFDNYREMWPYRDWVIAAFNRNQPFDRFTIEQLAGDLLPEPTRDQLVATGFHRCNITTNEGGTIPEENLANYARDRVETTSWVWLGLTANCAACHDHKFDPVTMKDFYSLAAFFRNTTQGALDGNIPDTPPVLVIPREADEKRWGELAREIEEARAAAAERKKALRAEFDAWAAKARPEEWDAWVAELGEPLFHLPPAAARRKGRPRRSSGEAAWIWRGRRRRAGRRGARSGRRWFSTARRSSTRPGTWGRSTGRRPSRTAPGCAWGTGSAARGRSSPGWMKETPIAGGISGCRATSSPRTSFIAGPIGRSRWSRRAARPSASSGATFG